MSNEIGNRLNQAMGLRGLTQTDIINKTGITKGALSSYLSGRYEPKHTNIYKLAKVLDVSPVWLMGFDVPMNKEENYYDKQLIKTGEEFIATKEEFFEELKKMIKDYYDLTGDQLNNVIEYIEFLKSKK